MASEPMAMRVAVAVKRIAERELSCKCECDEVHSEHLSFILLSSESDHCVWTKCGQKVFSQTHANSEAQRRLKLLNSSEWNGELH